MWRALSRSLLPIGVMVGIGMVLWGCRKDSASSLSVDKRGVSRANGERATHDRLYAVTQRLAPLRTIDLDKLSEKQKVLLRIPVKTQEIRDFLGEPEAWENAEISQVQLVLRFLIVQMDVAIADGQWGLAKQTVLDLVTFGQTLSRTGDVTHFEKAVTCCRAAARGVEQVLPHISPDEMPQLEKTLDDLRTQWGAVTQVVEAYRRRDTNRDPNLAELQERIGTYDVLRKRLETVAKKCQAFIVCAMAACRIYEKNHPMGDCSHVSTRVQNDAILNDLIDPFSGTGLRKKISSAGLVVYSVGPNLRDDGGVTGGDPGDIEATDTPDDIAVTVRCGTE